jgi:hypothetical protein
VLTFALGFLAGAVVVVLVVVFDYDAKAIEVVKKFFRE